MRLEPSLKADRHDPDHQSVNSPRNNFGYPKAAGTSAPAYVISTLQTKSTKFFLHTPQGRAKAILIA